MRGTYEVRSGRRTLVLVEATTAQEAVMEYVRSLGCGRDEMQRLGTSAVAWRGAVFRAVAVESPTREDAA